MSMRRGTQRWWPVPRSRLLAVPGWDFLIHRSVENLFAADGTGAIKIEIADGERTLLSEVCAPGLCSEIQTCDLAPGLYTVTASVGGWVFSENFYIGEREKVADAYEGRCATSGGAPGQPPELCALAPISKEHATYLRSSLFQTAALADMFRLSAKHTTCVVFNVCHSEIQAMQVVKYIPYVIGMHSAISDRAALKFAEGFYDSLFAGEPFGDCYEWGVNAIHSAGIPEYLTPRLKVKEPQLTSCQTVVGRFYYVDLNQAPTPLDDTGFSTQRAHAQVWQIEDVATHKISFIEQTIVNLRSDTDGLLLPYTSEWVFEETQKEADADGTQDTSNTLADTKRVRRIGLDDFTLDMPNQDLLDRFEAAKRSLLSTSPPVARSALT